MRQYLIRVIACGILCALATVRFQKSDAVGRLIHLMCGIFMTLTVISPWKNIRITSLMEDYEIKMDSKDSVIAEGEAYSNNTLRQVISQQCSTYIVEKANGMGVNIDAEVVLNPEDPPTPCAVTITGSVSPYAKARLEDLLTQDLGIPKEQQTWK